ncbi:MAG: DNA mismatch repair protein MutS [Comamonadaceae bacterium CG_4_9_14_3_um_filter_60_33]|nr:MAG: DNA mismatch repair protein MutS [Comamonadaceae bacterium CG2_30_59_20]PIY28173.1 MAG: DNA mismatch repair protein MutS [Comamonadaceae bacterium CG_4_10_14_3_um_filter_60_42]PJB44923.1 MAG: DNA mismatch repair protein MutS [Comamonadaceae bacterium CG_4_9_14_3_um_filter_60_33]
MTAVKVKTLGDLKVVKRAIAEQARQRVLQASQEVKTVKQAASDKDLFTRAAGAVKPLPDKRKLHHAPKPQLPQAMQYQRDEKKVLKEAISDEFDVSTLLECDEHLSFRRPGIGTDVTRKLRRGDWSIQRQIDLHGLRRDDAREALSIFIREAHRHGIRCVRVVHGKGLGSPGKAPVLKSRVHSWLVQKNEVLAFVQAKPADGGAGALVVLLMATRTL